MSTREGEAIDPGPELPAPPVFSAPATPRVELLRRHFARILLELYPEKITAMSCELMTREIKKALGIRVQVHLDEAGNVRVQLLDVHT